MLQIEEGKEEEIFIQFVEDAVARLAEQNYTSFLKTFDRSRLSVDDLIRALKYLDEERQIVKIDSPITYGSKHRSVDIYAYNKGNGYAMDYDLLTNGELNDLTLQVEFLKMPNGYMVSLEDLHTL